MHLTAPSYSAPPVVVIDRNRWSPSVGTGGRHRRNAQKSRCARERDGWGRLSGDGPGHYNPDPSEGPWGGGIPTLQAVHDRVLRPDSERTIVATTRCTKGEDKPVVSRRMPGAGLS